MKIAYLSDLHIDVGGMDFGIFNLDEWVDVIIIAGDVDTNSSIREMVIKEFEKSAPVVSVPGNHDFWGLTQDQYPPTMVEKSFIGVGGMKIAGATLWTDLHPVEWLLYKYGLNDCQWMPDWKEADYTEAHNTHKNFLLTSDADIIVSHHSPSFQSMHPRYMRDKLNCCFMSNMDEDILAMKKPPKLWIHGHIHDSADYMIGDTRVLCWPRGYPHEANFDGYKAKIIEI